MRILHVINNLGSGGAEKLLTEALPLIKKSHEVEVLLLNDKKNVFLKSLEDNNIDVAIIPSKSIIFPSNIFKVRKHIINGDYDVVHAHLFPTLYWVSIASKLIWKDKPAFIYTEHSTYNRRRDRKILKPVERCVYSAYDRIISVSEPTQAELLRWLRPKQNKINRFKVIRNAINVEKYSRAVPYKKFELGFGDSAVLICMVGRFSAAKDQATVIRALTKLPEHYHLLLVGEGSLRQECENVAKSLGVSNRVHFLGFRIDVDRILKTVDVITLSSHWEGFGLSALEGMAAGKPVIVSDITGLSEVVKGAGLVFKPGDYKELASKITLSIENSQEKKYILLQSADRVNEYSIEKFITEYSKTYDELIK